MRVVQTELTKADYNLLVSYAEKHGLSLKEALRVATRLLLLSEKADPNDPIFSLSTDLRLERFQKRIRGRLKDWKEEEHRADAELA
ncbi:MAG TPA: hypothetical protein VFE98_02725 [Candidatus Bathyarchaeia archaeon]|nr:hypothetical protein [Candidatus Bathyarchaeia archaeon]